MQAEHSLTESRPSRFDAFRTPLMAVGVGLVLCGAFLLFLMAMLVYQVLNAPEEVALVQFVLEHVRAGDTAIYGSMKEPESGQNIDFVLNWSESVRTISFLFLGVAILGILAGIAKIMISGGIGIVRLVAGDRSRQAAE